MGADTRAEVLWSELARQLLIYDVYFPQANNDLYVHQAAQRRLHQDCAFVEVKLLNRGVVDCIV